MQLSFDITSIRFGCCTVSEFVIALVMEHKLRITRLAH